MTECRLITSARVPYTRTWRLMLDLVEAKRAVDFPEALFLVEHDPVLTMGRRGRDDDLLIDRDQLARLGVEVHRIERGGLVTWHGPGQLVVYPVFRLRRLGLGVVDLVRALEEGVIRTLTDYGLEGFRRPDHPGVFTAAGKIASIGLAVRHNVSFHGLAFNYHPDLNHFRLINPCGLTDTPMTSASALLDRPLPHQEVRTRMAGHLARLLDLSYTPWTLEEAEAAAQGS